MSVLGQKMGLTDDQEKIIIQKWKAYWLSSHPGPPIKMIYVDLITSDTMDQIIGGVKSEDRGYRSK